MYLRQLGWDSEFQHHFSDAGRSDCIPARVAEENKDFYRIFSEQGELLATIAGRIRFRAEARSDFPAVGDWTLVTPRFSEGRATIEEILPRKTILARKMAGRNLQQQVIASNIDTIFIVTSLNQELNLRRMERYLAIAWESGSRPVVILNKADLCSDPVSFQTKMESTAHSVPVYPVSGLTGDGTAPLLAYLTEGKTAAFIGSSGVGKSTIINHLAGHAVQHVQTVRDSDSRGRHTTTSRQMILLPQGGIVIDTPGMREIGMWESENGLARTFEDLEELAGGCRFRDCRHVGEPGCAVGCAVEDGTLSPKRLENFHKLEAELKFLESKTNSQLRQANKARAKRASRTMKKVYKERAD